jgi:hypothetical protein
MASYARSTSIFINNAVRTLNHVTSYMLGEEYTSHLILSTVHFEDPDLNFAAS